MRLRIAIAACILAPLSGTSAPAALGQSPCSPWPQSAVATPPAPRVRWPGAGPPRAAIAGCTLHSYLTGSTGHAPHSCAARCLHVVGFAANEPMCRSQWRAKMSGGTLAEPLPNMDAVLPVAADSTTVLTAVLLLTFQSPAKRSPEPAACPPVCSGVDNAARGHPGGVSVFNGLKRRADRGGCGGSVLGIRRSKVGCARHRAKLPHSAPPSPIASSRPLMIVEAHRQRTALSTQPPEADRATPPQRRLATSFSGRL